MDPQIQATLAFLGVNVVGWAVMLGIMWQRTRSQQAELTEHKRLPGYRAHGNGPVPKGAEK